MLVDLLFDYLHRHCGLDAEPCMSVLLADYQQSGARARPKVLRSVWPASKVARQSRARALLGRQSQHQRSAALPDADVDAAAGVPPARSDRV